jgi:chromosome segregation ATPase
MPNHSTNSTERVLRFPSSPPSTTQNGKVAVDLVYQAAELVRDIENRSNETTKHAQSLAERAVEKLRDAEERIQELEAERRATQDYISEANVMVREAAEAVKRERSRVKAAEEQLRELELRTRDAEARAKESENAVVQVESAIRIHLLGQRRSAGAA